MNISEHVFEQSILDIELERSLAKMNVLAEMCRCYEKHEMFTEYASDSSVVTECGIFLEADGATANNEEKKKKTRKEFFKSAWTLLCNLWERFHECLKKLFADSMTKTLEKIPDGTIIIPKTSELYDVTIGAMYDSIVISNLYLYFDMAVQSNDVEKIKEYYADKSKFDEMINELRSIIKQDFVNIVNHEFTNDGFTKEEMVYFVDVLKAEKKLRRSSQIMKDLKIDCGYEGNASDIKAAVKNLAGFITTTTKYIEMVYTKCIKISEKQRKAEDL